MIKDKYSALWLSYSSISDYLKCPRLYFLRNIYRDPKTNRRVTIVQPSLSLGQVIHDTIEIISRLPQEKRFQQSLISIFFRQWVSVSGKIGGFRDDQEEDQYKKKGQAMIKRIMRYPGPLGRKAIKIRQDLPYMWLSEEENIILCGKIDWLEYLPDLDAVHIIDFKTGKYDEDPDSLQLSIYYLLAKHTQKRPIVKVSYWYLEKDIKPISIPLPDEEDSLRRLMEIAKKIALARKLEHFSCRYKAGCQFCKPYKMILSGQAHYVGVNGYGQDVYMLS